MLQRLLFSVAMFGAAVAASAQTNIPITNFSFESPALTPVSFTSGSISGWTVVSNSGGGFGVQALNTSHISPVATNGTQVAYSNNGPHVFSQDLSATLQANTMYTLSMSVGDRFDTNYIGYQLQFRAGGSLLAQDNNTLTPANGSWVQSTVSFTTGASHAQLGQTLQVRFGSVTSGGQTVFDNITLTASAIPEPSTYAAIAGAAMLGLALWRRKRAG
jgi:hypothetical protein